MAYPSLVEVDNIEIVVLVNDEIDYISPSPNAHVKHTQSFRGAPVDVLPDPAARGGAKVEFPMRNLCCGALGLSLLIVRIPSVVSQLIADVLDCYEGWEKPQLAVRQWTRGRYF